MPDPVHAFATLLNCIDGRVQLPVNDAVRTIFDVSYVDTITQAGIIRFLSDEADSNETMALLSCIQLSLEKHGSRAIAVAAHHDCAGNRCDDVTQKEQLFRAAAFLKTRFAHCEIVGLWTGNDWAVRVVVPGSSKASN